MSTKINYECHGYIVFTDCPFGRSPMVGSIACEKCDMFVSHDEENCAVECNAKNDGEE